MEVIENVEEFRILDAETVLERLSTVLLISSSVLPERRAVGSVALLKITQIEVAIQCIPRNVINCNNKAVVFAEQTYFDVGARLTYYSQAALSILFAEPRTYSKHKGPHSLEAKNRHIHS